MESYAQLEDIRQNEKDLQDANKNSLRERAKNVYKWKLNIEHHVGLLDNEIRSLLLRREYLCKALTKVQLVQRIAYECLKQRSMKWKQDDARDNAEIQLTKEKSLAEEIIQLIEKTSAEISRQIEQNKEAKLYLEILWSNKTESYNIECVNISYNNKSTDVLTKFAADRVPPNQRSTETWEQIIADVINKTEDIEKQSEKLWHIVDEEVLTKCSQRLRTQADEVEIALTDAKLCLQQRIHDLQVKMEQVVERLSKTEGNVSNSRNLIHYLDKSLMVAQSRLDNRLKQPLSEICYDDIYKGLTNEIQDIKEKKEKLQSEIYEAEIAHKDLLSRRLSLKRDIEVKSYNLWIDVDKCISVRSNYPTVVELSGH